MNRIITIFAFLMLCSGCKDSDPQGMDKYTIEYSIDKHQFGVVVAEDGGVSKKKAQTYALQRAAQVAHDHGYRYFVIHRESQVVVMKTEKRSPHQDMPTNIYYELIQSDNFGRDRLQAPEMNPSNQIPAYQIEFACQESKPSSQHYDVCDFVACD
ncbi:MAG: hypothetical protein ACRDFB_06850 [Rhabdochlamydiaceae bacterium]